MNSVEISVRKLGLVCFPTKPSLPVREGRRPMVMALAANMMTLGYIPSEALLDAMMRMNTRIFNLAASNLITTLMELKGADVVYRPMYPNFPEQVMYASECELFFNAILHYFSQGEWKPQYTAISRAFEYEHTKFKTIDVGTKADLLSVFTKIVSSNDSISEKDYEILDWFLDSGISVEIPNNIPHKEIMCHVVAKLVGKGDANAIVCVKTAVDVLRVASRMSGGDVSLAENTKFKRFTRRERKILTMALAMVIKEEDIARHRGKFVTLFHALHVGDYSEKVWEIARKPRNNLKIETFNGKVQHLIDTGKFVGASNLLESRPSEFARRLDHLLRSSTHTDQVGIVANFISVVDMVPTRVLLQLIGHLNTRHVNQKHKFVMPKGLTQQAFLINKPFKKLPLNILEDIKDAIEESLLARFAKLPPLGNVYLDDQLQDCPLPTQMRSASEGLFEVARGTNFPVGDKSTIRLFIYWKGQDIDLSGSFHDENFRITDHLSYTKLRSSDFKGYHSGDITSAPSGAAEFIDIDIESALAMGHRYLSMNVQVFSGPTFEEHEICYAGWMMRDKPNSNEIFEPSTVEQRISLTGKTKHSIPVIFDLKERKIIWTDITTPNNRYCPNNIECQTPSIEQTMDFFISRNNKVSLHYLFGLHAEARGTLVNHEHEADIVFGTEHGDTTPYDINTINAEYVVD